MSLTAEDLFGSVNSKPLEVTPPGAKPVLIRWPTFSEWYELTLAHKRAGGEPSRELICQTVAVCLSDAAGRRRLTDSEAAILCDADPRIVAWLYKTCWDTVLDSSDKAIEEEAKN